MTYKNIEISRFRFIFFCCILMHPLKTLAKKNVELARLLLYNDDTLN